MKRILAMIAAALGLAMADPAAAAPEKLWEGLSSPVGMAFDAGGNLYIAEWGAGRVSRIAPDGGRTVFAEVESPSGLAIAADGTVYVASYSGDTVIRFAPGGARSVFVRGLATPAGLGFDRGGRLLIANRRSNQILAAGADGGTQPVIGGLATPVGAVQTGDGGYVVANIAGGITILRPDGRRIEVRQGFSAPGVGLVRTPEDRVFAVDYGGTTVREILPEGTSRAVADGLRSPVGLTLSPDGRSLLTATWGDGAVYRIPIPER